MSDFINTVDVIGDEALTNSIIDRSITEFRDNLITSIGNYALSRCDSLATIDFPSVTTIDEYAFDGCGSLSSISLPNVTSIEACAFKNNRLTSLELPALKTIHTESFSGNKYLETVTLPALTYAGEYSFYSCSALTTVKLPLLTGVKMSLFAQSTKLRDVYLPSVTSLATKAFQNCNSLTTLDLPATTRIEDNVFLKCSKLATLILRSETKATLSNVNTFQDTPIASGTGYIYVPRALLSDEDETMDYRRATNWSTYANQFRAIEDYPAICSPIGKVWKQTNMSIGDYAFVKYINGLWVAGTSTIAYSNKGTRTSTDGKSWTTVSSVAFSDIVFFKGVWCSISGKNYDVGLKYSTDLRNWSDSNIPSSEGYSGHFFCNEDMIIAATSTGIYTSTDGMTWTKSNYTSTANDATIVYNDGVWFMAPAGGGGIHTSTDGLTWTRDNSPMVSFFGYKCLAYNNGMWVAASKSAGIFTSTDGTTWTTVNATLTNCVNLTYANGLWYASRFDGLYYSSDGVNWSLSSLPNADRSTEVHYHDGLWVATYPGLSYSIDGRNWISSNLTSGVYVADYANGVWVAADEGIYYSDGLE